AFVCFAELVEHVKLAFTDHAPEARGASVILQYFDPIEPLLSVSAPHDDACSIPFANGMDRLVRGRWNHVIERGTRAIAILAPLGFRVQCIIKYLILEADV